MEIAFEKLENDDESHNSLIFKWWRKWGGNCEKYQENHKINIILW